MSQELNVNEPDVVIVFLPEGAAELGRLRRARIPRIVVVGLNAPPPTECDDLEEWVRFPEDASDFLSRLNELETRLASEFRPVPQLDAEDALHLGRQFVHLSTRDAGLLKPLIEHFEDVVPREELLATLADGARIAALPAYITRLRKRLWPFGLTIASIRSAGYMLGYGRVPTPDM
ncbi:MAG TPA: helix-turn-helix domain-containing protein [Acidimicrobiia bacterium]|jgi:hypothetical protein